MTYNRIPQDPILSQEEKKVFPGLVNRKRVIATLEDKANITGFAWTRPHSIPKGFVEHKSKNGDFFCTLPITIKDVDGTEKKTVRTTFYEQDKRTPKVKPAPQIGNHVKGKAARYHGTKSANWKQAHLTLAQIIETLNAGYAFAPGLFDAPAGESQRAAEYCEHRQIVLLDGDEWTDAHPAPRDIDDLSQRYPDITKDFYWIGESISSRSSLKPELRTRLMLVLPKPIFKGETELWETVIDAVAQKYPFIARGVGVDQVRLSFGNARPESENIVLGGITSDATFAVWEQIASERREKAEALRLETEKQKTQRSERREAHTALNTELKKRGHPIASETYKDPIWEFCEVNPARLIVELGLGTGLGNNSWNWADASPGRSFELKDTPKGININPFSETMKSASPKKTGDPSVNAHRYILFYLHKLDITQETDKPELRRLLADMGYGTHPDDYRKAKRKEDALAIREGLKTEITRKPVKLFKSQFKGILETLDTARDFLKKIYEGISKFFAIRTDTGTGKTELAVTYALEKEVAIPTQSGVLRDEIVGRATDKGISAWGYRGIESTDETDGYMPCIQSERFRTFRDKGFNPYLWICGECPVYLECKERGYLSQPDRAKQSALVALPFPTAYLDPRLRNWAKLYMPRGKDGLILHDDLPLASLFYECRLSGNRLRRIRKDWKGTQAEWWADGVLECFSKREFERLGKIIEHLDDETRQSVRYALTQCVDPISGVVLSPDEYLASPAVDFSTADTCAKLPQLDSENHDILTLFADFFTRYPRISDAPCYYDTPTESFVFYLPPKPYFAKKTLRIGFASATLDQGLINRVFPNIEFYDAAATEWEKGARLFQLRTNGNPRGTVLESKEKFKPDGSKVWEWVGLNATGETYWQNGIDFIKANPKDKHAVFSYKVVIEQKQTELDALGVVSAWFGNLAGLDTAFEGVKYFHILFCPEVDPASIDHLAKLLYGDDTEPLHRDAEGELKRTDEGVYTDARVQLCRDALVIGELRQVVGRARLNLYPNQVFLWTSREIDGISNREESVHFEDPDWLQAGNDTAKLIEVVKNREQTELEADTAIETGNVEAVKEKKAVGKSQAYELTQDARKNSKAERDSEVFRRYDAGEKQKEIKDAMGIGLATVNRILNTRHF